MKLKSIYLLFILFIPSCSNSVDKNVSCNEFEIVKNNVKSFKRISYMLDEKDGKNIRIRAQRKFSPYDSEVFFYNTDSIIVKEYSNKDIYLGKKQYLLKKSGIFDVKRYLDSENEIIKYTQFNYDKLGMKIQQVDYSASNLILMRHNFIYDSEHNCIEKRSSYPMGNSAGKILFKKDEQGRIVEEKYFTDNGIHYKTVTKDYNEKNLLKSEIVYNVLKGEVDTDWSYEYQYDDFGNWILRTDLFFMSPCYEIERLIQYRD